MQNPTRKGLLDFNSFIFIFLFSSGIYAQNNFTLSGIITDDTGESLIGATVYTQDKSRGVVSNEYGFYSLTLEEGTHTLVISFIGFLDQNLIKGFVDPKKIGDHYQYMGILVVAVLVLLFLIIQFDRNSEQK